MFCFCFTLLWRKKLFFTWSDGTYPDFYALLYMSLKIKIRVKWCTFYFMYNIKKTPNIKGFSNSYHSWTVLWSLRRTEASTLKAIHTNQHLLFYSHQPLEHQLGVNRTRLSCTPALKRERTIFRRWQCSNFMFDRGVKEAIYIRCDWAA